MKKIIYILLLLPVMAIAQSQDQNYVKTIIYRDTTNTLAPYESVTYYDGLGRPIQQLAGKMSASGMDIITHIEYDSYGRQVKKYLPYPTDRATLEFDGAARTNTVNYYVTKFNDSIAYSQSFLEPSPLGRVLKQSAPGAAWKGNQGDDNDRTIKYSQQVNVANEVRRLKANANLVGSVYEPTFVNGGNYAAGQLYKTITKDENWTSGRDNTTEEFRNKDGQLVLQRTYIDGVTADTYYVYDQFGNLTYVLPPKAQGTITYLENLCYRYKYDKRNRIVERKLPGKRTEYIVYDSQDRVIATGPTLTPFGGATATAADQGWLRTYYDVFGRVAFTGWYQQTVDASAWATLQNDNNDVPVYAKRGSSTIDNIALGYNTPSGLSTSFKLLSVNYYDNYLWMAQSDRPTASTQVEGVKISLNTKGLLTGSWMRVLESASSIAGETTYRYYDYRGRALRTKATNYLGGYTQEDGKFDFIGTPLYSKMQFRKLSSGTVTNIWEGFEYSDQGRLLGHTHQINNLGGQKLSTNTYDELGQLVSKNVGGVTDLGSGLSTYQKVDYKYNIRGWLTDINDVEDLEAETVYPEDLFAYRISYNTIGDDLNDRVKRLYNGNISETQWISAQDNVLRKYSYTYDNANRLKDAIYQKPNDDVPVTESYNESLQYDINGNITRIYRNGGVDDPNTVVQIDALEFTYPAGSNQLTRVVDNSGSPQGFNDLASSPNGTEYIYDANGNMLTDLNKGITSIKYNHLNLPVEIVFNNNSSKKITYLYNAAGVKLKKTVVENSNTVVIDYLSGFQYKNNVLQFFPTAEGYVDYTSVEGGSYNYVYQYRDHLGNVRMNYAYSPPFKTDPGGLKIKEESHYYPFGLRHLNYNMDYLEYKEIEDEIVLYPPVSTGGKLMYNYKYNGKELQDELGLNMYDYGARNYDPALGRWMNIDPLAEMSRRWTPYNYCYNNPVVFVDPDGMKAEATPDWSFSDYDGKPSGDTQEAAFRGTSSNIGGHNDPGKSSASNNDGGGGGISWFKRTVNTVKGWFGSGRKSSVTAEEGTWTFDPILAGDIFSGGQVTKQAEALDVYKKDGINAYLYQTIANAHREELFNFITGGYGVSSAAPSTIARAEEEFVEGTFSVLDWHGYPAGGPKPNGPFRLLEGVEYSAARQAANSANRTLRASNPSAFEGLQIHEIQPVKFNGNPTDISNKLFLTPQQHIQYTNFWNALMRNATKK